MKKSLFLSLFALTVFSSCGFVSNLFHRKEKEGCPLTRNNIGAEKIASGDAKAIAAARKAARKNKGMQVNY
jgi:hypothetical protein